jgi:hypothetical protein
MESVDVSRNHIHDSTFIYGSYMVVVYTYCITDAKQKNSFSAKKIRKAL